MDVVHSYEQPGRFVLRGASSGAYEQSFEELHEASGVLKSQALRDMRGEGFPADRVAFTLELEVTDGRGPALTMASPGDKLEGPDAARSIVERFCAQRGEAADRAVQAALVRLKASSPVPHHTSAPHAAAGESPEAARKGSRRVYWEGTHHAVPVYQQGLLACGHRLAGLAIVESDETTILVPPGMTYTVDQYLNGIIEEG